MTINDNFDFTMSRKLVIGELVAKNARKFPGKEAIVYGNKRITWEELDQRANRLANALLDMGVKKGDKVAVLFYNCSEIVECYTGIAKVGAVVVPVNFRLAPLEIEYILSNSDSSVLIFDYRFLPAVEEIKTRLPFVKKYVVSGAKANGDMEGYEELLAKYGSIRPEVIVEEENDAFILYTSGTTGRPKGAVISHKNILINVMVSVNEYGIKAGWSQLCITPFYHIGSILTYLSFFYVGGKTVILENFDPRVVMETLDKEKSSFVFMVPTMWQEVLQLPDIDRYDCAFLKIAVTGAAIVPIQLKRRITQQFLNSEVFDGFGQTEMSANTCMLKPEFAERKEGSVGRVLSLVEFRVVDDEGKDVPQGEVGEIVYRGPTVMKGYYKNPEANADSFEGGWFHSGDLVRVDEEGFVYVVDRKKDMIISGGENIYPAEIEAVLYNHPKILEAAVVGVSHEKWGESPKAVVVIKPGESLTEDEVIDFCNTHLARYKRVQYVAFVDSLPRNASGKVLKTILRKEYGNALKY